jgi:valyl-tRNA synthetase
MWEERGTIADAPDANHFAVEWFESRLNEVQQEVVELFKDFKLSEALKTIYILIWDDFCNWYLEWVKPGFEQPIDTAVYQKTVYFFEQVLQLLHPFMPFATEEIYQLLQTRTAGDDLIVKQFTTPASPDANILLQGALAKEVISSIRDARNKHQLKPKDAVGVYIDTLQEDVFKLIEDTLSKQVNAKSITYTKTPVADCITLVVQKDKFYLETEVVLDPAAQKEELLKELAYQQGFLVSVEKKLSNERFVQNAKADVVDAERKKQSDAEAKIAAITESLKSL